eukprot:symbB.v1.2.013304.t1/scaffold936.1/size150329/1
MHDGRRRCGWRLFVQVRHLSRHFISWDLEICHDRRALSRCWRDTLDATRPVAFYGPPPLPAKACYRVPIGAARASYGVWVKAHKAVSLETHLRPSKRGRAHAKWDQTVTKSSIGYGAVHEDG